MTGESLPVDKGSADASKAKIVGMAHRLATWIVVIALYLQLVHGLLQEYNFLH